MKLSRIRELFFGGDSGRVFRGMITLAWGTASARIIGLACLPILTRIYSPEDFGVLSVFTAIVTILSPILCLRYVLAVPLPRTDGMAMNLLALSGLLILATSSTLGLLLGLYAPTLLKLMAMDVLGPWWWLVVAGTMAAGLYETLSMWATRKRTYSIIARTQVTQSFLGTGLKLVLGLLQMKPFGLLLGQVVSQCAGSGALLRRFHEDFSRNKRKLKLKRMVFLARYYHSFPLYRLPSVVLLALSIQAPLLLTATLFGPDATGHLGMALMAIALPVGLFADNAGKAYFAEISRIGRKQPQTIRSLTKATISRAFVAALPPTIILMSAGKYIFSILFGENWSRAGTYASILSIYMLAQFMQRSTAAHLMSLYDGQKELLALNVQRLIMTALCFWSAQHIQLSFETTLIAYSLLVSSHYIFSMYVAYSKIPKA